MTWQAELSNNITTLEGLLRYFPADLPQETVAQYEKILEQYPMSVPQYYLSLIDRDDHADPVRKMCIPSFDEISLEGDVDTSGELQNTVMTGMQHKYAKTVLVLSTNSCAMYCRHCFRKRLVGTAQEEIVDNLRNIVAYVREHTEVSNVLVSGGDSFLCSNHIIGEYLRQLSEIEHLDFIRFGTRTPVVLPHRISEDPELLALLRTYNQKKQIYVVSQFNHPNELTEESLRAVRSLQDCGVVVHNQSVLLQGVNDDPAVLAQLLKQLTASGVSPYYVFQCRPVLGVKGQFQVPLRQGYRIIEQAKNLQNGLGKGIRYAFSHESGKIEILGELDGGNMLFKYHQAKDPQDQGRIFIHPVSDHQCWLDEATPGR